MARYFGQERRRYKRLAVNLPVKYRFGRGGSLHEAHTRDISAAGVRLGPVSLANEWMLGSCEVELEITLPHLNRPLKIMAEVVRIEEGKTLDHTHHRRRHDIRLRFCKIHEEDRKIIADFVEAHSPSKLKVR